MSYERPQATTYPGARPIDAGLQSYMQSVFHTMALGLVVTGLTAFATANTPALFNLIFGTPLKWVVLFAPLAFIILGFTPGRIAQMSSEKLKLTFLVFTAVMGLSMAALFQIFTGDSIARVFFITAATFSATSLYGYTTKRDLTGVGSFLFMGMIGIFIAMLVNMVMQSMVMQSAMVHFVVSVIGVIVFTGLTAWDVQRLRDMYAEGAHETNAKVAIVGALSLYINFINLFQMLLQFAGVRRD